MSDDSFSEGKDELKEVDAKMVHRSPSTTDNLDTVFSLLSNAHCRYLLYYLSTMDGEVAEIEDAVKGVRKYKAEGTDTDNQVNLENIRVELHHSLLPKLNDVDVIEYDPRHGTIRFTGDAALNEWVEQAQHKEME